MVRTHTIGTLVLALALLLTACGRPVANTSATLVAPTATPNVVATQTRVAELSFIATLTAPTATRPAATPTPSADRDAAGTFLGSLDSSDILIGVVTDGLTVRAYICDGATVAEWFTGPITEGKVTLTSAEGTRLTGSFDPRTNSLTGQVALTAAPPRTFNSLKAKPQESGGLFRATGTTNGQDFTMGVIVLSDGRSAGIFQQGKNRVPVLNPQVAATALTATLPGVGAVTAPRLTAP